VNQIIGLAATGGRKKKKGRDSRALGDLQQGKWGFAAS